MLQQLNVVDDSCESALVLKRTADILSTIRPGIRTSKYSKYSQKGYPGLLAYRLL